MTCIGKVQMPQDKPIKSMHSILDTFIKLPESESNDVTFSKCVEEYPILKSLVKAHETLEKKAVLPERKDVSDIVNHIFHDVHEMKDSTVKELSNILRSPYMTSLLHAHDVISMQYVERDSYTPYKPELQQPVNWKSAIRMVGLTKRCGENLGLSVATKNEDVVVTRIFHGGLIHKQGLLSVGDIIKEVNGQDVRGQPELLKKHMRKDGAYVLKVVPSYKPPSAVHVMFVKCNCSYNALNDPLIPSLDAGLSFKEGDILQVVDCMDLLWWQARHVNEKGESLDCAGLIPSLQLQECRSVWKSKLLCQQLKSLRMMYNIVDCAKLDSDYHAYEEVALMPAFVRKVVVLLCRDQTLAFEIMLQMSILFEDQYKAALIHTTDQKMQHNKLYCCESRNEVESDIKENLYLDYDKQNEEIFGTKYDSIRNVMKSTKVCIKSMAAKRLKFLMNSEFMPYVVLVDVAEKPTGCDSHDFEISKYSFMVNSVISYTSVRETCHALYDHLEIVNSQHQWLPVSWVY